MKRIIVLLLTSVFLAGCATVPKQREKKFQESRIIWRSDGLPLDARRPEWTIKEPPPENGNLVFVGLSGRCFLEKDARDDAYAAAAKNIAKYIGNDVKVKVRNLTTSSGLSSKIMDPVVISNRVEEQISKALISRVKASEWYIEKYQVKYTSGEDVYYQAYVKAVVPKPEVERAISFQMEELSKAVKSSKSNEEIAERALDMFGPAAPNPALSVSLRTDKGDMANYREGELVKFYFKAGRDCYFYLFHMDAEGNVVMLFPNVWEESNRITAGREYVIPDERMNFDFKVTEPFGAEVAVAVATVEPIKGLDNIWRSAGDGFRNVGKIKSGEVAKVVDMIRRVPSRDKAVATVVVGTYR